MELTRLRFSVFPHQHSWPYSTPAYRKPLDAQDATQDWIVMELEVVEPPLSARVFGSSTLHPTADQPDGREVVVGAGKVLVPVGVA